MRVTHIMRADEWISSTPLHVMLYDAFGWTPPAFAHLPMILGPDKAKLSKRHGATTVTEYREQGYLPEALLNYLEVDETRHFTLNEAYLALLTVSELESLAEEVGLKKAMGERYAKAKAGKRSEFIQALLAVEGFTYKGAVPKAMR